MSRELQTEQDEIRARYWRRRKKFGHSTFKPSNYSAEATPWNGLAGPTPSFSGTCETKAVLRRARAPTNVTAMAVTLEKRIRSGGDPGSDLAVVRVLDRTTGQPLSPPTLISIGDLAKEMVAGRIVIEADRSRRRKGGV